MLALLAALLAAPAPPSALSSDPVDRAVVARGEARSEKWRGVAEYFSALAAFTAVNAGGVAFVSSGAVQVSQSGQVSMSGATGALTGASLCFALAPLASAIGSWAVGKTSDTWNEPFGAAVLGAYGSAALAVGTGVGLGALGINRSAGIAVNSALYLTVPLGTVLAQNAFRTPKEPQP
jgi:hypothetical protein